MPDINKLYDIFIIYHPSNIKFVRRLDGHMKANAMQSWVTWDDLSMTTDGQAVLKAGILRSHLVAIALSPASANSQICNELIQFAVQHNKRFVTLILDENIDVDVHPAIAENPYIYFRAQDNFDRAVDELLPMMELDPHVVLHTELLVRAYDWDSRDQSPGLLLPLSRVEEARLWLADGANQQPKPSELQVEFIHASRRQKSNVRRNRSIFFFLLITILILGGIVVGLLQVLQSSQDLAETRSTEVAMQQATSDANEQRANDIASTSTAEFSMVQDFAGTATSAVALAQMAMDSAMTADVAQQSAQEQANTAIFQARLALTAQADAENALNEVEQTESENSATLQAQVQTAEFESAQLVETAAVAQEDSLNMALTATSVMLSADDQGLIAQTQVANLATAQFNATQQLQTLTALEQMSADNAGTAIAFAQIAEQEAEQRSTAEAELQAVTDTVNQAVEAERLARIQSLIVSSEQVLNTGDVDLALALALYASEIVPDSPQVYRVLSRAADLSPTMILSDVVNVQFNPTGDEFAVLARNSDSVQVYDLATRQVKYELQAQDTVVTTLRYSLDGRYLVTGAQDGTVIVWSTANGAPIHRLNRHIGVVNGIAMHPDGTQMVTAGVRPMLVLWDLNTGEEIQSYLADRDDESLPNELVFSADGARIVGWSNPAGLPMMIQWDSETLAPIVNGTTPLYRGYDPSGTVAWSGGQSLPAFADDPNVGDMILWEMATGNQRLRLSEGFSWSLIASDNLSSATDSVVFVTFTENAETALIGVESSDGGQRAVLVDTSDGTVLRTFQSNPIPQLTDAIFVDENTVISTTRDNRLVLWSVESGQLIREIGVSTRALQDMNLSPAKSAVTVKTTGGDWFVWSIADASPALTQVIMDAVTGTALNQTGDQVLLSAVSSTTLQEVEPRRMLINLDNVQLTRMNPERTAFAVNSDNRLTTYDADSGEELASWQVAAVGEISRLAVNASGTQVILINADGEMWLVRDDADGAFQLTAREVSPAFAVRFNPDSRLMMSLHPESAILWDTASTSEIQRFPLGLPASTNLRERVQVAFDATSDDVTFFVQIDNNLAGLTRFNLYEEDVIRQTYIDVSRGDITADGAYLLLALTDNSVQLIDIPSGEVLRRFVGHSDQINAMIYQPQNEMLFTASNDNTLIRWDVETGAIAHQYRHPADVLSMTVSEDGERILSEARDGVYRLWQRESLEQLVSRIRANFTVRDFTCAEREFYDIAPLCE